MNKITFLLTLILVAGCAAQAPKDHWRAANDPANALAVKPTDDPRTVLFKLALQQRQAEMDSQIAAARQAAALQTLGNLGAALLSRPVYAPVYAPAAPVTCNTFSQGATQITRCY